MYNSQLPPLSELPTSKQLIRSTILAMGVASALLVTVVLPSEYGIDPTGVGSILNLTQMGEIKAQLAQEAAADRAKDAGNKAEGPIVNAPSGARETSATVATKATVADAAVRSDQVEVELKPGQGAEIKVAASKGTRIGFEWSVSGGVVNYDNHADAPRIPYHGYGKGKQSAGEKGTLVAAFDGNHGWYWRNRTERVLKVVLKTNGAYTDIKRVI